jgi:hypothetical protein
VAGIVTVLGLAPALAGAAFTLRTEVDARRIGVEDQLQLTITFEGGDAPDEIPLPPLKNLEVASGPFQSSQMSIVNGRVSQSRSHTYVLRPKTVGNAEVGALTVAGQTAPAIAIEVVAGSIGQRPAQRPDPFRDPFEEMLGRSAGRTAAPKLRVTATASRLRLHVGEPLVLTYWIDTQTSVADLQFKDPPQFAGFWAEDLERPQSASAGEPVTIEGETYRRFPVLRKLLFPTKAGALVIPAATFRVGLARQSFFDAGGVVERATKPVTVTVDPLPEAPGFSGAVGKLRASASLDREAVPFGEAATLRFRVEGTGNLKWIDRGPDVSVAGAKVFPPQVKGDLATTAEGIRGSRTWEFVVVPETSGRIEIPALAFSYFDPVASRIVATTTASLALRVEGGAAAGPGAPAPAGARTVGALPLRSGLDLPSLRVPVLSGATLALLVATALLLHVALWGGDRLLRRRPGVSRHASARSVRAALRDLERAASEATSKEQAAGLIERAVHEAFGDLADEDESERARAVRALLDEARFVRFAPQLGDYSDKVRDLAARAAATVRRWA